MNFKWDPESFVCPHCGAANPDDGDKCGNCEKNPSKMPKPDEILTKSQFETLKAVRSLIKEKRRKKFFRK